MLDMGITALVEPVVDNFEDKVCQARISPFQISTLQLASTTTSNLRKQMAVYDICRQTGVPVQEQEIQKQETQTECL